MHKPQSGGGGGGNQISLGRQFHNLGASHHQEDPVLDSHPICDARGTQISPFTEDLNSQVGPGRQDVVESSISDWLSRVYLIHITSPENL